MIDRTRQVLQLLADPTARGVLDMCEGHAQPESALREELGVSHMTMANLLRLLESHGLVERSPGPGTGGRRGMVWRAKHLDAVRRFDRLADAFALELLQLMADEQDAAIEARRRDDVAFPREEEPGTGTHVDG